MSLAIAFKGPEGIVLAADSRVTLAAVVGDQGERVTSHFDNATKLLNLEKQRHVAFVTYGRGAIDQAAGPRTAHSFLPEFEASLNGKYDGRASVQQVAQAVSDFYADQWQQAGMPPVGTDDEPMVFLIAGFDEGDAYGKIYEVVVPTALTPVEKQPDEFGVTWGGQMQFVSRLLGGVDPQAAQIAKDTLGATDEAIEGLRQNWREGLALPIPYQFLPLQDCVDLSTFLIEATAELQGWTVAVRGVGGAVDVATITRTEGFKAVQQKTIKARGQA